MVAGKGKKAKAKKSTATAISDDEADDSRKVVSIKLAEEDSDAKRVPMLLFQTEVEKHIELLWKQEAQVLNTLWGSMVDLLQGDGAHYSKPSNDYRMFSCAYSASAFTLPPTDSLRRYGG